MAKIVTRIDEDTEVVIPAWVTDNASFVRWAASEEAPEKGKFGFFQDEVWLDTTTESILHNLIKTAIAAQLTSWNHANQLGDYFGDGMLVSVPSLEFTSEPDGAFVSHATWESGKVHTESSEQSRILFGAPDMVLEVVSRSTARKDLITLRELYHDAGILEYWLVDSRKEKPELSILKYGSRGYLSVRSQDGWSKSTVLGGSFKLDFTRVRQRVQVELLRKK